MESNLALLSPKPVLGLSSSPNPKTLSAKQCFGLPLLARKPTGSVSISRPRSKTIRFASVNPNSQRSSANGDDNGKGIKRIGVFASRTTTANSRSVQETTSVGVNPQPYVPPPTSQVGSPLFWFGVGIGFSVLVSTVTSRVKKYAMQQAFKTMMSGQMGSQENQFSNTAFPSGSPFGFPPPSASGPGSYPSFTNAPLFNAGPSASTGTTSSSGQDQASSFSPAASKAAVDVSATKVDSAEPVTVKDESEVKTETRKPAFVDVSPEENLQKSPFEDFSDSSSQTPSMDAKFAEVVQNGAASKEANTSKGGERASGLSVEALEKMMEDPAIFETIKQHLPQEMRDPATFKWMLQNPVYRQQLQEMLDNMGGSGEWNSQMMDTLKDFNINNPEVKQQFDQLGVTPEDVVSKILANPDLAMAFQNPRVQQAIMDCSQNPMNMVKYQNDAEVMAVFNKIQQLFPGSGGF